MRWNLLAAASFVAAVAAQTTCKDFQSNVYCRHVDCGTNRGRNLCARTCNACLPLNFVCEDTWKTRKCMRKYGKGKCKKRRVADKCSATCPGNCVPVCSCDYYLDGGRFADEHLGMCGKIENGRRGCRRAPRGWAAVP